MTLEDSAEEVFLFPLSFAQQRLWFLQQMNPQSPVYNVPVASRLLGKLNVKAIEQALNEIVQRHEILRTTFQMVDAQPMQVISSHAILALPLLDLTHLPETTRESEAHLLAVENLKEPFDLVNGPLMRAVLVRLNVEDHLLLETQVGYALENCRLMRSDGRQNGMADSQRDARCLECADERLGGRLSKLPALTGRRVIQQSTILGDYSIEDIDALKQAQQLIQLPAGHEEKLPAGSL